MKYLFRHLYRHVQTGVTFALPLLVIGGVCRGMLTWECAEKWTGLLQIAGLCERLAPLVFSAYAAYSMGSRPALIPALVSCAFSQTLLLGMSGAFLSALFSGLCACALREAAFPWKIRNIKALLLLPTASCLISVALLWLFSRPVLALRTQVYTLLRDMPLPVMCAAGAAVAGVISLGMGGEKGNICSLIVNLCWMEGCIWPMAAKIAGCVVPGMALVFCFLVSGSKKETGALLLKSICQITEEALPYLKREPSGAAGACAAGAGLAGMLTVLWNVQCPVPHGGLFLLPFMTHPVRFLLAVTVGTLTGGVLLLLVRLRNRDAPKRKPAPPEELPIEWKNF